METIYSDEHTRLQVTDKPDADAGGACHEYVVHTPDGDALGDIRFQHGPRLETGDNGVQHIHLLHMIRHRLECFQEGQFASDYNQRCLEGVQMAIAADVARTEKRTLEGVEGKNELSEAESLERVHFALRTDQIAELDSLGGGAPRAYHMRKAVDLYLRGLRRTAPPRLPTDISVEDGAQVGRVEPR